MLEPPGISALREGTSIIIALIGSLIGWVTIMEVEGI